MTQGLKNQQWVVDPAKGTIQFAADPTKCLDNLGGSTAPGNRIGLWECEEGDESQQWSFDNATGTLNLTSSGGVCLDLPGGAPYNGNWLEVWGCARLPPLPCPAPSLLPLCLLCSGRSRSLSGCVGRQRAGEPGVDAAEAGRHAHGLRPRREPAGEMPERGDVPAVRSARVPVPAVGAALGSARVGA